MSMTPATQSLYDGMTNAELASVREFQISVLKRLRAKHPNRVAKAEGVLALLDAAIATRAMAKLARHPGFQGFVS